MIRELFTGACHLVEHTNQVVCMQATAAERLVQDEKQREADLQDAQNQEVSRTFKQDFDVLTQPLLKESMSDVAFLCLPHTSLLCTTHANLPSK